MCNVTIARSQNERQPNEAVNPGVQRRVISRFFAFLVFAFSSNDLRGATALSTTKREASSRSRATRPIFKYETRVRHAKRCAAV